MEVFSNRFAANKISKFFFSVSLSLLFLPLLAGLSYAQDDDLLVELDQGSTLSFQDYLIGEFGIINANNAGVERRSVIYNVGIEVPWDWGKFFATYGGVDYNLTIQQKKRAFAPANLPERREIKISADDTDLREALLQLKLGNHATLYAGRIRNSWGLFEVFTPSLIVLPLTANVTSLLPNKIDFVHGQDQVQLSIFPTGNLEVQLIAMDKIRSDAALEASFQRWINLGLDPEFNRTEEEQNVKFRKLGKKIEGEEGDYDTTRKAMRLLYFANWGKLGLTYFKGASGTEPLLHTHVGRAPRSNPDTGFVDTDDGGMPIASINEWEIRNTHFVNTNDGTIIKERSYLFYPEASMVSFELEVPTSPKWTWRFEHATIDSTAGLGFLGSVNLRPRSETGFEQADYREFLNAIGAGIEGSAENAKRDSILQGTALYKSTRQITGLGFVYTGKVWNFNLTLLNVGEEKADGAQAERIVNAYNVLKEKSTSSDDEDLESFVFPLFTVLRTRGDENQHKYGMGLGALGTGFGIGGFYSYNFTEDLNVSFSGGFLDILGNTGGSTSNYENDDEDAPVLQVGLGWRF